jgi:hypothetical protein
MIARPQKSTGERAEARKTPFATALVVVGETGTFGAIDRR